MPGPRAFDEPLTAQPLPPARIPLKAVGLLQTSGLVLHRGKVVTRCTTKCISLLR